MRRRNPHILVFVAHNGPGPYPCVFCERSVDMVTELHVHHLDHNHDNNDPDNLAATHTGCHTSYHQSIRWRSPEERFKQGAHSRGKKHPPDCGHCAAVRGKKRPDTSVRMKGNQYWKALPAERRAESQRGRKRSAAERLAISEGVKKSWERRRVVS
jgi:hypothetical protein